MLVIQPRRPLSQSHRLQPERGRGGAPVAGVDGGASFLRRAGEVECVGGTQKSRGREFAEALCSEAEKGVVHRMPTPQAAGAIGLELVAKQMEAALIHDALTEFAMKDGDDFRLADEQATYLDLAIREGDDVRAVRFGQIKFGDVAGVKIDHRPSRMSEMICVLSVPP